MKKKVKNMKVLSEIVKQGRKQMLFEFSSAKMRSLIDKFSSETDDGEKDIIELIGNFNKFKKNLEKRDIDAYDYDELKRTMTDYMAKRKKKQTGKGVFTKFVMTSNKASHEEIQKHMKMFNELKPFIGGSLEEIVDYEGLKKVVKDNYKEVIGRELPKHLKSKDNHLMDSISILLAQQYLASSMLFPAKEKSVFEMTPTELEAANEKYNPDLFKQESEFGENEFDDIPLIYDENNLSVYRPVDKNQCIRLRNDRNYCISLLGSQNYFYNYRLTHGRTVYFVIDHDKPYDDVNYSTVVLVNRDGGKLFADKTNSGEYSGTEVIPWSQISRKVPKLKDLEHIFVPVPFTEDEKKMKDELSKVTVPPNKDPLEVLKTPENVHLWLEVNSPSLSDYQYSVSSPDIRKKYISLGHDLTVAQINDSDISSITYYVGRKKGQLVKKSLGQFTLEDFSMLELNILDLKKLKEKKLQEYKLKSDFNYSEMTLADFIVLSYPEMKEMKISAKERILTTMMIDSSSDRVSLDAEFMNKVPRLYPEFDFLKRVNPKGVKTLQIKSDNAITYKVTDTIANFKELTGLMILNGATHISDKIAECDHLNILIVEENKGLTELPLSAIDGLKKKNLRVVTVQNNGPGVEEIKSYNFRGLS